MSRLVVALCTSNAIAVFLLLWRPAKVLVFRLKARFASAQPITPDLLGQDYVPPLPKPIADALERSRLCFLATASGLEPHLSLMRFSYCRGLLDPSSEVMFQCPLHRLSVI